MPPGQPNFALEVLFDVCFVGIEEQLFSILPFEEPLIATVFISLWGSPSRYGLHLCPTIRSSFYYVWLWRSMLAACSVGWTDISRFEQCNASLPSWGSGSLYPFLILYVSRGRVLFFFALHIYSRGSWFPSSRCYYLRGPDSLLENPFRCWGPDTFLDKPLKLLFFSLWHLWLGGPNSFLVIYDPSRCWPPPRCSLTFEILTPFSKVPLIEVLLS